MDGMKVLMTSKMFKTAKSEKFHLKIGHSWNDLQWDQDLDLENIAHVGS